MSFAKEPDFQHGQTPRTGVLLVNLGTPDEPTAPALRRYLAEFLGDPRVVEIPRLVWLPLLHGVILRTRPRRSGKSTISPFTDSPEPTCSTHASAGAIAAFQGMARAAPSSFLLARVGSSATWRLNAGQRRLRLVTV